MSAAGYFKRRFYAESVKGFAEFVTSSPRDHDRSAAQGVISRLETKDRLLTNGSYGGCIILPRDHDRSVAQEVISGLETKRAKLLAKRLFAEFVTPSPRDHDRSVAQGVS